MNKLAKELSFIKTRLLRNSLQLQNTTKALSSLKNQKMADLIEMGKKFAAIKAVDENITKVKTKRFSLSFQFLSKIPIGILKGYQSNWNWKWFNYSLCD